MTETHSPVQIVHTTTITPAMREARRALKYAGGFALLIALWLGVGLSVCSVNPELSTRADHLLGSVTHNVCSWLLSSLGLMSFSLVLLIARFGRLLCSSHLPQVSISDVLMYSCFTVLSATQLQLALNTTSFGAPIGGVVGAWLSAQLLPLGALLAQGLMCLSLFGLFFFHASSANSQRAREDESAQHEELHLRAQPVKSMNAHLQQQHSHIFDQVVAQPPEFKEESQRFEAVDSFYDDLALNAAPSSVLGRDDEELSRDLIFQFDIDSDEPGLTFDLPPVNEKSAHEPRLTSPHHPRQDGSLSESRSQLSADQTPVREPRSSVQLKSAVKSAARTKSSPIEQLSQEISPKIARELILQRGFDAQEVTLALIKTKVGPSLDHYTFSSPIAPPRPVYEITEHLNRHIRRTLGRTEPSVLLNHYTEHGQHYVEVSWPKRTRVLTETQVGVQTLRKLKRAQSLSLYLGEFADGDQALIPFKELRSLLITGGASVESEVGLDLVVMNLIHQAQPEELRLIIFDQERSSQLAQSLLPHLYSPVISERDQLAQLLEWISSEYRRRRSLMARLSLQSFEKLQQKRPQEVRVVFVIPQLSQLSAELQSSLVSALDKIAHSSYHVGIHIVINSRSPLGDKVRQSLRGVDAHLMLAAASIEEANQLCAPGAEWLLPQHDMLLKMNGERPQRISAWQLPSVSYHRILSVFSSETDVKYINPEADFKRVIPLSRARESRSAHTNASAAPMAAMSDTRLPPV